MENDKTFLPYFITEDIYVVSKEVAETPEVVESSKVAESTPKYVASSLKYKGTNKKEILVLIENRDGEYLNSEDEIFLSKILQAVGIDLDDIALVNLEAVENFEQIQEITHTTAIAFTPKYAQLNTQVSENLYEIQTQEAIKILMAHPLHEISQEKEKKMKLWKQLQILF